MASLSHEMRFDVQKLRENCDFGISDVTLSHKMRVEVQKTEVKLRFGCVSVKAYACQRSSV